MNIKVSEDFFTSSEPKEISPISPPGVLSLFCGAGGLDVGFLKQGFTVPLAADFDSSAVRTYNQNHPGETAVKLDLLTISPEELYQKALASQQGGDNIQGIIGGPPCQGFSRGNVARCPTDPRNQLALKYAEIVNYFHKVSNIKFFLFENVPEILAKKNVEFLALLRKRLSKKFNIYEKELNACDFGVPQNRRRYFIVGIAKSVDSGGFEFPVALDLPVKTVSDAIKGLPEPYFFKRGVITPEIPHHPNHWTMQPKSKRFTTGDMPKGGRSFIKLVWDKPSRTVAYGNREIHVHPDGNRRLSIYEAMKLQGFPSSYSLWGSLSAQVKQISNAVAPPVAEALAERVKKYLFS
ncbi:DNA cytosine methyltransferase [Pseudomonas lurida]|uniref:DNA cytosine methyltransferase n=1 Tax=Pseudomonas lurida TaxID=244566 RepID=UPI0030D95694